jgi:hypothetical protein
MYDLRFAKRGADLWPELRAEDRLDLRELCKRSRILFYPQSEVERVSHSVPLCLTISSGSDRWWASRRLLLIRINPIGRWAVTSGREDYIAGLFPDHVDRRDHE